ncbi:hypothetical protein DB42_AZ00220 [Neochlamydia sp. EPS4]|nr:hypothetical protein DB42_AZ00220 [Neochlamydia sp. EPS4]
MSRESEVEVESFYVGEDNYFLPLNAKNYSKIIKRRGFKSFHVNIFRINFYSPNKQLFNWIEIVLLATPYFLTFLLKILKKVYPFK